MKSGSAAKVAGLGEGEATAMECPELPAPVAPDLASLRESFRLSLPCGLRQAWRVEEETNFSPGIVHIGWRSGSLLVLADLTDEDIFTRATDLNQRLWELGDAFEIFLQPAGQSAYVEFQVSPNNQRLQLRYENADAIDLARKTGSIEKALVHGEAFRSKTWIQPETKRWFVHAEIPARSVGDAVGRLEGCQWRFSFGRYDHGRGRREPVISSTSPHTKADFHRLEEWGVMRFRS